MKTLTIRFLERNVEQRAVNIRDSFWQLKDSVRGGSILQSVVDADPARGSMLRQSLRQVNRSGMNQSILNTTSFRAANHVAPGEGSGLRGSGVVLRHIL